MIIPGSANPLLMGGDDGGYQISRSVRFRSSASAYFSRTLSSGSATTWTWSGWVKRGTLAASSFQTIFGTSNGANEAGIRFVASGGDIDRIEFYSYSGGYTGQLITTQVFRDPSAWYHFVAVYDTTNATSADRIRLYVNGVRITSFTTTVYPSTGGLINTALVHNIGAHASGSRFFDGYMTEMNFIDGQALTPTSFGAFDAVTGVWNPKKYSGTYGTNGFYLNFSDNSAATAAALGKDSSGNGNNWTPNNISVTNVAAPNTNDSMVDTPTNYGSDTGAGGEVRGNYAVVSSVTGYAYTSSNGNLTTYGGNTNCYFSMPVTGKMYFEAYCTNLAGGGQMGFVKNASIATNTIGYNQAVYYGVNYASGAVTYWVNGTNDGINHGTISGNTLKFAVDGATGKVWIGSGSTWYGSGDPANGTNPAFTISLSSGDLIYPMLTSQSSTYTFTINAGQQPFGNAAPSGFKAMCTQNLPTPTISNGANYMASTLYTGNGSTGQSVVNTVNGVSFAPDFAWVKVRSTTGTDHYLADTVRGATKYLQANTQAVEGTNNGITAFNSNGFSVGAIGDTNTNTASIVGWQWKGGGTATTIAVGSVSSGVPSIASSVSANTTAGFSVVSYTGNITAGATIGHGLGVAPSMIIVKERSPDTNYNWFVYHASVGNTAYLLLNLTNGSSSGVSAWNNVTPSTSVFTLGSYTEVNKSTAPFIAYCFAPISGYSAFGSYSGNNTTDGPFVYLGFRPRFLIIKSTSAGTDWVMIDTARNPYNLSSTALVSNSSNNETTIGTVNQIDILSNGFKPRNNTGYVNASQTYIYAAFAENPFTISRAR